ncbi:hypothetical protein RUM4293_02570 [Ruegeria atlantica]|uniref:Uncharacterized protein n=1 Tax=Ruegeria atlantica TaxID=81569 RepID=A0A0P1ENA2_9RHOB|nr:hypothetical protein RUM4293_02570 [Ruegeria atlantica]
MRRRFLLYNDGVCLKKVALVINHLIWNVVLWDFSSSGESFQPCF